MAQNFFDRPSVLPATILAAGLLLTGALFSWSFYSARQSDDTISVTGSAKTDAKADSAKWTVSVTQSAYEGATAAAYAKVASDAAAVKAYFKQAGIADTDITSNTVTADQNYNSNSGPTSYNVHEEVTIASGDVDKVQSLAQNVGALISRGISVSPQQPEYYVSTLPDLRVQLLGQAIADAKARAQEIAKSGGSSVGKLKSAASGVVQVLAPNSTQVEDYGSYDTSTTDKEISVTARATFVVR